MKMIFEDLSDDVLHSETVKASRAEKTATLKLLDHLFEVNRRKLYARPKFGNFSTLKKYVVKNLGYSDDEAKIRIAAMKLIEKAPAKIRPLIEKGELSLTNANLINRHLENNQIPESKILEVIDEMADKSSREILEDTKTSKGRGSFLHEGICEKIARLGWTDLNDAEIFESLLEEKLRRQECEKSDTLTKVDLETHSRYIPVRTMEIVLKRSGHKCEYPGCTARHNLEWNHKIAFAKGGGRGPDNIELLCWAHNQLQAIEDFGIFERVR